MGSKEVLDKIRSSTAIKAAYIMDGKLYKEFVREEGSVTGSDAGMPLDNRAFKEMLKRTTAVCLFSTGDFEEITEHIVIMEDPEGNMVGHDIPECMAGAFDNDPNLFFLSDDFVMNMEANMREVTMVLLPKKDVRCVGEAEGAKDVMIMFPAPTTDLLLRRHFGIRDDEKGIASSVLAFNHI